MKSELSYSTDAIGQQFLLENFRGEFQYGGIVDSYASLPPGDAQDPVTSLCST
jgi:hypothetical protein